MENGSLRVHGKAWASNHALPSSRKTVDWPLVAMFVWLTAAWPCPPT